MKALYFLKTDIWNYYATVTFLSLLKTLLWHLLINIYLFYSGLLECLEGSQFNLKEG